MADKPTNFSELVTWAHRQILEGWTHGKPARTTIADVLTVAVSTVQDLSTPTQVDPADLREGVEVVVVGERHLPVIGIVRGGPFTSPEGPTWVVDVPAPSMRPWPGRRFIHATLDRIHRLANNTTPQPKKESQDDKGRAMLLTAAQQTAFENFCRGRWSHMTEVGKALTLDQHADGTYVNVYVQHAWECWQAGKECPL